MEEETSRLRSELNTLLSKERKQRKVKRSLDKGLPGDRSRDRSTERRRGEAAQKGKSSRERIAQTEREAKRERGHASLVSKGSGAKLFEKGLLEQMQK